MNTVFKTFSQDRWLTHVRSTLVTCLTTKLLKFLT